MPVCMYNTWQATCAIHIMMITNAYATEQLESMYVPIMELLH